MIDDSTLGRLYAIKMELERTLRNMRHGDVQGKFVEYTLERSADRLGDIIAREHARRKSGNQVAKADLAGT